ncbi:methyltransferase domain-containing protein [Candidatus Nomurabacteria bacterium]|nr:methyltransferase domain-containing protein [Candidatus Nomurabacteria bacterium]
MFMDPVLLLQACHLKPTDSVADFGAGSGQMAKAIANIVTSGEVFAVEINRDLVARIIHEVEDNHIKNIHPLWGDVEIIGGSKLGEKSVDVAVFSNILFQLDDKKNALKEANRILKDGGHLIVVDWQESFGGLGPKPERVLNKQMAEDLISSVGFTKLSDIKPAGEHHYAILFKK